jgi:DNA-binding response OmpR family regulator
MKKILVIDDNLDIRENSIEILELAGFQVFGAPDGQTGIDLAVQEIPDVILCDIVMPFMNGYEVLEKIRRHHRTAHIRFVFLTARSEKQDVIIGMERGASDYLIKPFGDTELLEIIEARVSC